MDRTNGVYGWNTGEGGTHFHRIAEPLRVARDRGLTTAIGRRYGADEFAQYETVIAYELSQPAASEQWRKIAKTGAVRMVFDIDDGMWSPDWAPFARYYTPDVLDRMYNNARMAHVVTTSSWVIADHMERVVKCKNVHFVPYSMPAYLLDIPQPGGPGDRYAMGFAGSASHETDMDLHMQRVMVRFLAEHPLWDWHFWGKERHEVAGWPADRTVTYPWTNNRRRYFHSLRMDACIAPLKNTVFNRCKSALRFLENSALGIPSIIQDLDPYWPYLTHGVNGYYVGPKGFSSWSRALDAVAGDPIGRMTVAAQAREDARGWTTEAEFPKWLKAWNSV